MRANIRSKRADEVRRVVVDMGASLLTDESLSGTPTILEVGSSDLTISDIELNTLKEAVAGRIVYTDRAVTFLVAGGVAGTEYRIRVTAGTDSIAPQTLISEITFRVN